MGITLKITFPILSLMAFLPLLGAIVILLIPKKKELSARWVAFVFSLMPLLLSLIAYVKLDSSNSKFQFVERLSWIKAIGAYYNVGVDGISMPMVILTTILTFVAIIASWHITLRPKQYYSLILLLEVGMMGVFIALDFILFYVFWELVLIPMYFLIGIWGGPRKEYAAIKFFLYTFIGSIFMLVGILGLYFASGAKTFEMLKIAESAIPLVLQKWFFFAMFFGFAVKVPIVPFHTWLPDAHVEAPTAVSVLLAGVLLKMGTYAFIRIGLQIIPAGMKPFLYMIAVLGVISIIYGAYCAMVQKDLKKLVAYSSVSHMGFVMLGIASLTAFGVNGANVQMFSHGLISGMLFLLVGSIYDRTHTRIIDELGGLSKKAAILSGIFIFTALASMGMPALSGFIGEFLVLLGSFAKFKTFTFLAAAGIALTAGYMIWTIRRVCLGTAAFKVKITDASPRELSYMLPLCVLILILGFYPMLILKMISLPVEKILLAIGGVV